jgi:hypothetical protein
VTIMRLPIFFATVFAVTLLVCAAVTLLGNITLHGTRTIDWETSFRFAAVLGIVLPAIEARRGKGN